MATIYKDQFYLIDPGYPPPAGTALTFQRLEMVDGNDNGLINRWGGDSVNGSDITASWLGDTVTVNVPGVGHVSYYGITFYTASGQAYFTPVTPPGPGYSEVLQNGTLVSTTYVLFQGSLNVGRLGPTCFAAGTLIATAEGALPVEALAPGMRVQTLDNGFQPLVANLSSRIPGQGVAAPVLIEAGALGNARPLRVSQQHRILVSGWRAELFFGEHEVLVAARSLVNGTSIRLAPCPAISYHHLLFERHELVLSEGIATESLFLGVGDDSPQAREARLVLGPLPLPRHDRLARPALKAHEGALLAA